MVAAATPTEIVIQAEHLEVEEGVVTAEHVEIAVGEGTVTAEGFEAHEDSRSVLLETVVFAPCACEGRDPWSVQAESATVVIEESVRFRGGWLRLFDVPVVPIPPTSIPLRRRSGLLAPTLGYGPYGLLVAQPLYLTVTDHADVTLTPELRTARSARGIGEGRYAVRGGSGEVRAALGPDWETRSVRGAIQWEHAQDDGRGVFAASRGQILGDRGYLRDYGDSFLSRSVPFVEARSLGGFGPVEFGSRTYQFGGPTDHEVASMAVRRGGLDGPWGMVHSAEMFTGWSVHGGGRWDATLGGGRVSGQTTVSRPTWVGPFRLTPELGLLALGDTDAATQERVLVARSRVQMDARLGLRRYGARSYERLEPGVRVVANPEVVDGVLDPALRAPPWVIAPGVTWRRTGVRGLTALRAAVPLDDRGLGGTVDGRIRSGPWTGWLQADSRRIGQRVAAPGDLLELGTAGLRWGRDALDVSASWIYADRVLLPQSPPDLRDLHQARWAVGLTPPLAAVLRIDGGVAHSLDNGTIQQRWLGLTYTHPSRCLSLGGRGWWDADRASPEAALKVDFRL